MDKQSSSHTFESVWAALDKVAESQKETKQLFKETDRQFKETDRQFKETKQLFKETDRFLKEVGRQIVGISSSNGAAANEFFYNTLYNGDRKLFGEAFDDVFKEEKRKTKKGFEDEYDIMLFNGQAVCIVEVKYKADSDDVLQVLRKEKTFRVNFPDYKDKKLYLALASMSFHKLTEQACEKEGIAIIKQVGDKVIISDKNLKVF
jgi:hypothetical protein